MSKIRSFSVCDIEDVYKTFNERKAEKFTFNLKEHLAIAFPHAQVKLEEQYGHNKITIFQAESLLGELTFALMLRDPEEKNLNSLSVIVDSNTFDSDTLAIILSTMKNLIDLNPRLHGPVRWDIMYNDRM